MKVLTSKKAIIALMSLGSVVIAGTIKDINSRTVSKMHAPIYESASGPSERGLASEERNPPSFALTRVNMSDAAKVDGIWEITRIVDANEVIKFDKNNHHEDTKKTIRVPFKLIGTSKVMVNNDPNLVYNISLLSDFGTIAIFKQMGKGQEILEAKMVKEVKTDSALAVSDEIELVLERALNQSKSAKILTGQEATGEMILSKKSIEGLNVTLTNTNGEVQNIEISSAQLLDGGSFKADVGDEEVSGVVFNNGKDGYRLSFVTGPLAGAMLNFVTKEELSRMEEVANNANDSYFEAEAPEKQEAQEPQRDIANSDSDKYFETEEKKVQEIAQQEVLEERRDVASADPESYEPVKVLSADEVQETVETQGFSF